MLEPICSITNETLCYYYDSVRERKKELIALNSLSNLKKKNERLCMSETTRKKVRKLLTVYYESVAHQSVSTRKDAKVLNTIITLTLPSRQRHSDNEIKRECLSRFLELLVKKVDVRVYYWVAEKQKNDNIHFHILIDRYCDYRWIRKAWNQRLDKLGYIDEFFKQHGHRDPNSTDVEVIKNIAKSSRYVTKYTTKVKQQGGIEGRMYGMSDSLRDLKKYTCKPFGAFDIVVSSWIEKGEVRLHEKDFVTFLSGDIVSLLNRDMPIHSKEFSDYKNSVFDSLYYPVC